jgi:hypothetical protein
MPPPPQITFQTHVYIGRVSGENERDSKTTMKRRGQEPGSKAKLLGLRPREERGGGELTFYLTLNMKDWT